MKKNSFIPLPPFKGWVLQNFPFIEEDFDAITSYQLWCKVVAYLNNTNNNVNVLASEVLDIKNYFDNLDVQEEINNKLDEMAESGELTDIIAQYLQLAGILAFNTLSDLANAENLSNGSFTKIYGKVTYNDGYGAFYKVRALVNTDVIDGDELVALVNYPTLVAEKIPDANINNINNEIDDINEEIDDINEKITPINIYKGKNLVVFGDSWSDPEVGNSSYGYWVNKLASTLQMTAKNFAVAGAGFGRASNPMTAELTTANSTLTSEEKENTSLVVILGGLNDILYNLTNSDIITGMETMVNTSKQMFPNAKIILAPFNWCYNVLTDDKEIKIEYLLNTIQQKLCNSPVVCLKLLRFLLMGIRTYYRNDAHPTELGYDVLTSYILNVIYGGSEHIYYGEDISSLISNVGNDRYLSYCMQDGKVSLNFRIKFADAISGGYAEVITANLPPMLKPDHEIYASLYQAQSNAPIGMIRITTVGQLVVRISVLPENTWAFLQPIEFNLCVNESY